jgi:hypothetical protein
MATVGNMDFESYVRAKKAKRVSEQGGRDDAHAYAYVSDRNTRSAFDTAKPVELAVAATVRLGRKIINNELLGTAVKVGAKQFPRVFDVTKSCAETLGIPTPTIYVQNAPTINAFTYGTNEDSFIVVHSALVDHMSEEEMMSVIGHECGHIHNQHVVYLTTMHVLRNLSHLLPFIGPLISGPALLALSGWSRRAEVTCDRAGALCCGSVDISTRALAKLALGSAKLYEQLDLEQFLAQYDEGQEGVGKYREVFASHPWLPKRVKALRAFAESKLYREKVGLDGGVSMDEVDEKVHAIIKVLG